MKKTLIGLAATLALGFGVQHLGLAQKATTTDTMAMQHSYVPYTEKAFVAASKLKRVLFFHASWCPNCRAAEKDINANLTKIPDNVIVFKTDYDTEVALKKTYGITYQHTFVYVDAKAKQIKKWSGGATQEIIDNTKDTK